jgi:hypothetical protein
MHLGRGMAAGASHALLTEVDIGPQPFALILTQELVANPAAVAGGAGAGHGRGFDEVVTIQQATANTPGLADMAIAAAGMAARAVVAEHLLHFRMIGRGAARFQDCPVTGLCCM